MLQPRGRGFSTPAGSASEKAVRVKIKFIGLWQFSLAVLASEISVRALAPEMA
jgi:hypothetical protein